MKTILVAGCTLFVSFYASFGALVINTINTVLTENFNTLASSGAANDVSTLPTGWTFLEIGAGANTSYAAGTGSSTTGNTYSFGTGTGADRALGQLRTTAAGTAVNSIIGVNIENKTGGIITSLILKYTGEQWRYGGGTGPDRMDFQFSTDATSLTTGTWQDLNSLDFTSPITSGTGALDGNATANRKDLSGTIAGLSLASGGKMWLRWSDIDIAGSDDGLGIDDFSITAVPEPREWGLISGLGLLAIFGFRTWRERRSDAAGM